MAFCVILYTRIKINLRVCDVIPLGCSGGGPTQQAIQWLQLVSLKEHHTTACLLANINALNIYYIIACLLTNGSAAFKWKLHCHWLKGQQQHITVVKKTPNLHHLRLLLMKLKPISCHPYRRNHNMVLFHCSHTGYRVYFVAASGNNILPLSFRETLHDCPNATETTHIIWANCNMNPQRIIITEKKWKKSRRIFTNYTVFNGIVKHS